MLSLMQRSKRLSKNFYQQPIEWTTMHRRNNFLPAIEGMYDSTVRDPSQEAHLGTHKEALKAQRGKTVPNLGKQRYTVADEDDQRYRDGISSS